LAHLIGPEVVEDSLESFARFQGAGWETFESAIMKSTNFVEFLTPDLVSDLIADLLGSSAVRREVRDKVVDNFALYVPSMMPPHFRPQGAMPLREVDNFL
jgi:hypothetical protein